LEQSTIADHLRSSGVELAGNGSCWLRWLALGVAVGLRDARLVAAYLGHADLSTVSRYAHVAEDELHEAAAALAGRSPLSSSDPAASVGAAGRSDADTAENRPSAARAERFQRDRRELPDGNRDESVANRPK